MHTSTILQDIIAKKKKARRDPKRLWAPFVNLDTHKEYQPHTDEEAAFVYDDIPRYGLLKGGEGSGKSTAGIIKDLDKLRRGKNGIMVSTDLPHFKKSLWAEFRLWCPWDKVIRSQRYRAKVQWEPSGAFTLIFNNELGSKSTLICGGIKEQEAAGWEGPNVNFAHLDEIARHKTAIAIETLDGRIRIGKDPQLYVTTVPIKHWLFDMFGPLESEDDQYALMKRDSFVVTLRTDDNKENLSDNFAMQRRQSLNESEARRRLDAEWEDESSTDKFVSIIWWDNCKRDMPALNVNEPMVIALDASTGGEATEHPDGFSIVGVTRHPDNREHIAVRYCQVYMPPAYGLLDYEPIEKELIRLCSTYNVIEVCYDRYQLHDMCTRLMKRGYALFKTFGQTSDRIVSDKRLLDKIIARKVYHDGDLTLRKHIDNANKKPSGTGIRIVKSHQNKKVDAAVALSMAVTRCMYYNL